MYLATIPFTLTAGEHKSQISGLCPVYLQDLTQYMPSLSSLLISSSCYFRLSRYPHTLIFNFTLYNLLSHPKVLFLFLFFETRLGMYKQSTLLFRMMLLLWLWSYNRKYMEDKYH